MISLLIKWFIKDSENIGDASVRRSYGTLCGAFGVFLNIVLFACKLFVGTITKSIAVTADAFNNIADAGSSIITMIGFRLSGKKPDPQHPFGHGRMEYVAGLIVSMLIFAMGFELAFTSVEAIYDPHATEFSVVSAAILAFSVAVKLYMMFYNRKVGKRINSATMQATALDSLSDVASTSAVLASLLISHFTGVIIDGWVGLLVALFILFSGFKAAKETIEPLLGARPSKELVDEIEELVLSHGLIVGIHDLILHDYGPGRKFLSLHAEVPMDEDILAVHDVIDDIELDILGQFGIEAVIHTDPIDLRDERLVELKCRVTEILDKIGDGMTAHDFRIVPGKTHTNVIFDVVMPADALMNEEVLKKTVSSSVTSEYPNYRCVIKIDRSYA